MRSLLDLLASHPALTLSVVIAALVLALATGVLVVDLMLAGDWDEPSPLLTWTRYQAARARTLLSGLRYTGRHVAPYQARHAAPRVRKLDRVALVWDALTINPSELLEA